MSLAPPPAMRIKSHWFKAGDARTPADRAGAMAFIVFRVGNQMLKRMRSAGFDIDAGKPYFAFLREVLAFLGAVTDRMAYETSSADERHVFTVALVRHLARHVAENERDLLGVERGDTPSYEKRFVDLVNEVGQHYAEFGADPLVNGEDGFHPDFGFVRYLGSRLEPVLPDKDRHWVTDQVMAIEVPEALAIVRRAMKQLRDATPSGPRRASMSGE